MIVRPVEAGDFVGLAALFERDHSPCYCRYFHFTGTNKEWEARCALEPSKNRDELRAALGTAEGHGLIAIDQGGGRELADGQAILGWMKLVPQPTLHKLLIRSPYKGLESAEVWSIGCFLVDPEHRRRGVATALVRGAIAHAETHGITTLEAYPRVFEGMHDAEQWTGPMAMFESLGFEVHRDQAQYPVLRRITSSRT